MAEVHEAEIHDLAAHRLERYDGIGEALRLTRLQGGLTLEAVADALRIRYVNLLAIEEGRFDDLPGQAYVSGFVRAYAEYLDLDGEEVLRRFRAETSNKPNAQDLHFPEPPSDGWMPRSAVVTVSIVLAVVVFGGWYIMSRGDQTAGNLVAEVPGVIERAAQSVGALTGSLTRGMTNEIAGVLSDDPAGDDVAEPRATETPDTLAAGGVPRNLVVLTENPDPPVSVPPAPQSVRSPTAEVPANPAAPTQNSALGTPVAVPTLDVPARDRMVLAEPGATAPGPLSEPAQQSPAVNGPALSGPRNLRGEAASGGGALTAAVPQQGATEQLLLEVTPAERPRGLDTRPPATAPTDAATIVRAAETPSIESQNEGIAISSALAATPDRPTTTSMTVSSGTVVPPPPPLSARADSPRIYGQENTRSRVLVRAIEDSWVQVQSLDNELLMTRILKRGDVYRAPDRNDIVLSTGNAGGLEIIVDGVALPPLGAQGVVRRDIMLNPSALRAGPSALRAGTGAEG